MFSQLPRIFQAVHRYTDPWFFFCLFLFYFNELSWLMSLSWNHARPSQCHSADSFLFSFKSVTVLLTQCSWTSRNNGRFSAFCMLQWEHIVSVQTFCYLSPCTAQPGNAGCVPQVQPALQGECWVSASQTLPWGTTEKVYAHTAVCHCHGSTGPVPTPKPERPQSLHSPAREVGYHRKETLPAQEQSGQPQARGLNSPPDRG